MMKTLTLRLDGSHSNKLDSIKNSVDSINTDSGIIKFMIAEFAQLQQDNSELRQLVYDTENELEQECLLRTNFAESLKVFINT